MDGNEKSGKPNVVILIADCLRQANSTKEMLPFVSSISDIRFSNCYAPSTWTLPSHVSLFTGSVPSHHEVTRRTKYSEEGDTISPEQIRITSRGKGAGYSTAIFSENPHFSQRVGFDHDVDFVDDWINFKQWSSNFSAVNHIPPTNPSLQDIPGVLKEILNSKHPGRNLANTIFGGWQYFTDDDSEFPHSGSRVLRHLRSYLEKVAGPKLTITNLMETHNPHYIPPSRGRKAIGESFDQELLTALEAASDNRYFLFTEDKELPRGADEFFDTWDEVFKLRGRIYNTQIRYFDLLVEDWISSISDLELKNTLLIVTGDHGQLFGEEQMAGHHTSLHPHAINVPLFVSLPESWKSNRQVVKEVTSWIDLSQVLEEVMSGRITSGDHLVESLTKTKEAVVCVDGSGYDVAELKSDRRFNSELVDEIIATRKVSFVRETEMTVYESKWKTTSINKTKYEITEEGKKKISSTVDVSGENLPNIHYDWLTQKTHNRSGNGQVSGPVAERLESLGYK